MNLVYILYLPFDIFILFVAFDANISIAKFNKVFLIKINPIS